MSGIEERYRFVLRLLPASYRQRWEEDMVAAFLESVTPDDPEDAEYVRDFGRPSWSEIFSVVGLALRLRLGHPGAPPRYLAWAQAVRLAALGWLFAYAVAGVTMLAFHLWLVGRVPGLAAPRGGEFLPAQADRWMIASVVIAMLWLPAYVALLVADLRVARSLVLLAAGAQAILLLAEVGRGAPVGGTLLVLLALDALVALSMLAFHRGAPRVAARPWLVALPVGVAVCTGLLVLSIPTGAWWSEWPGQCSGLVVGAALVHLLRPRFRRTPSWSLALTLLVGAVLALRGLTLLDYVGFGPAEGYVGPGLIEMAALVAVGLPLAVLSIRALRRLPAEPSDVAGYGQPDR